MLERLVMAGALFAAAALGSATTDMLTSMAAFPVKEFRLS